MKYDEGYIDEYVLFLLRLYHVDEDIDVSYMLSLDGDTVQRRYIPFFYVEPTWDIVRYSDI